MKVSFKIFKTAKINNGDPINAKTPPVGKSIPFKICKICKNKSTPNNKKKPKKPQIANSFLMFFILKNPTQTLANKPKKTNHSYKRNYQSYKISTQTQSKKLNIKDILPNTTCKFIS